MKPTFRCFLKTHYVLLLLLLCLLSGCTAIGNSSLGRVENSLKKTAAHIVPFYTFNKTLLESISIRSAANSNQNLPVAMDIVFVLNSETAQALSTLSGPDWFANKKGLLQRYQQQILINELEIVPQTATQKIILPSLYYDAVSVFLFANYLASNGQYQADITQFYELHIMLEKSRYALEERNP